MLKKNINNNNSGDLNNSERKAYRNADNFVSESFHDVLKRSFSIYTISDINRSLPKISDGCKKVARRILWTMFKQKYDETSSYKKSARIIGDVIGQHHPHGDQACYLALVRLAQHFSINHPYIKGQGNFGSLDGSAGAQRYTEARLEKFTSMLLEDLNYSYNKVLPNGQTEKLTVVKFVDNYDLSLKEPEDLPFPIPMYLINGCTGIAVALTSNVPQHNLVEVIDAFIYVIKNPSANLDDVLQIIKGPDFPGGGFISSEGLKEMYTSGQGVLKNWSNIEVFDNHLEIKSIPYQVSKKTLIESIAESAKNGKILGVQDIIDYSDENPRIIIEIKPKFNPVVVKNQVLKFSSASSSLSCQMNFLIDAKPALYNLMDSINAFLVNRRKVVKMRIYIQQLKAIDRYSKIFPIFAIMHNKLLQKITDIILNSNNIESVKNQLRLIKIDLTIIEDKYKIDVLKKEKSVFLNNDYIDSYLALRMSSLTKNSLEKIKENIIELVKEIESLTNDLDNNQIIDDIICKEMEKFKNKFGTNRKTTIVNEGENSSKAIIHDEVSIVSVDKNNHLFKIPIEIFKARNAGAKGKKVLDKDVIFSTIFNSQNTLLLFTNYGKVFSLDPYKIFEMQEQTDLNIYLKLEKDEKIITLKSVNSFDNEQSIIFVTRFGMVKRNKLQDFAKINKNGKKCLKFKIKNNISDEIVSVLISEVENNYIFILTSQGMGLKTSIKYFNEMKGRNTVGVKGINLKENDFVVSANITHENDKGLLMLTDNGFGRLVEITEGRNRGTRGVIYIKRSRSNKIGNPIATISLNEKEETAWIFTDTSKIILLKVSNMNTKSRYTIGSNLVDLESGDKIKQLLN